MEIRQAINNDIIEMIPLLDEVAKIHIEKRPDVFKIKTTQEIRSNLEEILKDERNITLIAEERKTIVGVMVCKVKEVKSHMNLKDSKVLWIDEICVKQEFRRNRIGCKLIERSKEIARENNCVRLELNCWELNEDAMKFYEKQGLTTQRRVMEIKI